MITTAILTLVNNFIQAFLAVRPVWQPVIPPEVATVFAFVEAYNYILPINAALALLGITATLLTAMLGMKWGVWVMDRVASML